MPMFNLSGLSNEPKEKNYDVIVVGAGPGGLTASIYARRAGLKTLVFERATEGGQITLTNMVEDYPGFSSISGEGLAEKFVDHAREFGVKFANEEVMEMSLDGELKKIKTDMGNEYTAKVVVMATGSNPRKLEVPGEEEFTNKGVSYCAVCDGSFFKGKEVVVVGGGDSAVEEGIYLSKIASKVRVIHRRDKLRAQKIVQERAFKIPNMEFIWDTIVTEIGGKDSVEYVTLKNIKSGETSKLETSGVFIYVGLVPNSELVKDLVDVDQSGFILTDEHMETNVKGVYAVGDVRKTVLRQVVTAAADGAIAGVDLTKYFD
ncbi:thioredoxin-disulfide reductase [Mesoaciditoga sp.]